MELGRGELVTPQPDESHACLSTFLARKCDTALRSTEPAYVQRFLRGRLCSLCALLVSSPAPTVSLKVSPLGKTQTGTFFKFEHVPCEDCCRRFPPNCAPGGQPTPLIPTPDIRGREAIIESTETQTCKKEQIGASWSIFGSAGTHVDS